MFPPLSARSLVERLDAVITAMEAALTAEGLFVVEYGSGKCRDPSRGTATLRRSLDAARSYPAAAIPTRSRMMSWIS